MYRFVRVLSLLFLAVLTLNFLAIAGDRSESSPPGLIVDGRSAPGFLPNFTIEGVNSGGKLSNMSFEAAAGECLNPLYVFTGEASDDRMGWRVNSAGDVNGDGYDDIITGAASNDAGGDKAGRSYVFSGINGDTLFVLTGDVAGDRFGMAVGGAGDVNKDGYDDMIVGAWNAGADTSGHVYIFYGGTGPFPMSIGAASADWTVAGATSGHGLGVSASGIGDVDGDNYDDFIVGADDWGVGNGKLYVFSGQTLDTIRTHAGPSYNSGFGYSSCSAGDVNNDGTNDYIVGALWYDRAYVYSGIDGSLLYYIVGATGGSYDAFGGHVSCAGDINNDGYADMFIGAPYFPGDGTYLGRAYVYFGGPGPYPISETTADADYTFTNGLAHGVFGWSVTDLTDVDGDGFNEIAVGAMGYQGLTGWVNIYSGQAGALLYTIPGEHGDDYFGRDIAGNGDFDNDGKNDLIVGALLNNADSTADKAGRVFVYNMGDSDGDGITTGCDNCPAIANSDQADTDGVPPGDACCCLALRGNINNEGGEDLDISDLTYMVNWMFKSGPLPPCPSECDINADESDDISDLTYLVGFMFKSGPDPMGCP